MKLGFVVNPMAGIGGRVALKGSDGRVVVEEALARGGVPMAEERALKAIKALIQAIGESKIETIHTASGSMGASILEKAGLDYQIDYFVDGPITSATDTRNAVERLCDNGIDILMFAGGDGTARDVLDSIANRDTLPVVGIPAGCKIHSAVYAITPARAGELVAMIASGEPLSVKMAEVMDLDEEAFRQGKVIASCYGYLSVPVDESRMQAVKQGGINYEALALQDIAAEIVDNMEDDYLYFIGAGTTVAAVMDELDLPNSLLGVDVVFNKELIASDVDEKTMLALINDKKIKAKGAKIIVTAIGGQGHVFGRGNQQFSPDVISQVGVDNILIIATNEKLRSLNKRPLLVDTGDDDIDVKLKGIKQIITGYDQRTLYELQ